VDLIITDQTMPNMSGMELIAEVRKRKPAIRTILCTGYSSAVSSEQIEKHAIDAFVMKPLVLSELGQIVRGVLDGERSV
jgi:DNA-binding NtrC family response regulator